MLELGVTDCLSYPGDLNLLEIRLNSSYNKQLVMLELNLNVDFWNSVNKSIKSIISDINGSDFYKKVVKQVMKLTKSDYGSILLVDKGKINYTYSWDGENWLEDTKPDVEFSENIYKLQLDDFYIYLDEEELKIQSNFPYTFREARTKSYLNFPIHSKDGSLIGLLEMYKAETKYDTSIHPIMANVVLQTLPFDTKIKQTETPGNVKQGDNGEIHSDDTFLSIVDKAPISIFIVQNDVIGFVNNTACELLGYGKRDLIGKEFSGICSNKLTNNFSQDTDPNLNKSELVNLNLNKKNGKALPLHGKMNFITFKNENALLISGLEKIEITKPQEESEDSSGEALRLSAAVSSLRSAVTITDMDRKIIYVNPAHKTHSAMIPTS